MLTYRVLALLALFAVGSWAQSERQCPCNLPQVWLDIVVLIDNSRSMTQAGLAEVQANLATIAGQLSISQSNGQYSRFALITYNSQATIVGDLRAYNDVNTLITAIYNNITITSDPNLNIEGALQAAGQVIQSSHTRNNVKTVILLYASAYSSGGFTDPLPAAAQLKESGTPIVTLAFTQADTSSQVDKISALSSPNYAFNSTDRSVINETSTALCQVNCFCPNNFVQYGDRLYNPRVKYGECLRYIDIDAAWTPAKFGCQNLMSGAHLAQIFSIQKHNFLQTMVANSTTYTGVNIWHIGLSYNGTNYVWEGPNGSQTPLSGFSRWGNGFPDTSFGNGVVMFTGFWENENQFNKPYRYVCQVPTCDTSKYCATVS